MCAALCETGSNLRSVAGGKRVQDEIGQGEKVSSLLQANASSMISGLGACHNSTVT